MVRPIAIALVLGWVMSLSYGCGDDDIVFPGSEPTHTPAPESTSTPTPSPTP
jgi:hypothetical protein